MATRRVLAIECDTPGCQRARWAELSLEAIQVRRRLRKMGWVVVPQDRGWKYVCPHCVIAMNLTRMFEDQDDLVPDPTAVWSD